MLAKLPPLPPVDLDLPDSLSQREYEAIKLVLPTIGQYRDLLLVKVLRNTGLRISEILGTLPRKAKQPRPPFTPAALRWDGPAPYLLTIRGKQRGEPQWERVYLNPDLGMELQAYIQGLGLEATSKVFDVGQRQFERLFKAAAQEALGRPAHPHQLRGLYVSQLADGGVPLAAVSKLVGHHDTDTTLRWYYKLGNEKRAELARRVGI